MSLGYHIQNSFNVNRLPTLWDRLPQLYEQAGEKWENPAAMPQQRWNRFYIGDEFCIHRLPDLDRIREILSLSKKLDVPVTLLTPVVSDFGIETCMPLFSYLSTAAPETEIVVNDWGMLVFLREQFPAFRMALGRLLNKGFKDPRVAPDQINGKGAEFMFSCATFDFKPILAHARTYGVSRLEKDLLPHGDVLSEIPDMATSIYFPYGYVTTGRVCRSAALTGHESERFAINSRCTRVCEKVTFRLEQSHAPFKLIQSGNTVFYLYPPKSCHGLLSQKSATDFRLIFQDLVPESGVPI